MKDKDKTKEQLIDELRELRQQNDELKSLKIEKDRYRTIFELSPKL